MFQECVKVAHLQGANRHSTSFCASRQLNLAPCERFETFSFLWLPWQSCSWSHRRNVEVQNYRLPPLGGRCCPAGTVLTCAPQPHCLSWLRCLRLSMICSPRRLTQSFSLSHTCLASVSGKPLETIVMLPFGFRLSLIAFA